MRQKRGTRTMRGVAHRRKRRVLWFDCDYGFEVRCKNLDGGDLAVPISSKQPRFHGIAWRQCPDLHQGPCFGVGYVKDGDAPVLAGRPERDRCRPVARRLAGAPVLRRTRHFDQAASLVRRERARLHRRAAADAYEDK